MGRGESDGYGLDADEQAGKIGLAPDGGSLPFIPPEDMQFFGSLLDMNDEQAEAELTAAELVSREVTKCLLQVKNGDPVQRRSGARTLGKKASEWGAKPVLDQLLPLLRAHSLEDEERHALVKVLDRLLLELQDGVKTYAHRILAAVAPMLIDEDFFARAEARDVISNLAKAAGLAAMIATVRTDIDHDQEYVRNTTARALAVVAVALGLVEVLPFLRAVCGSKGSWKARHTGCKVVQQVAILAGVGVLPHLPGLVAAIGAGLSDEQIKVRQMAAQAVGALAKAAHPFGVEVFDSIMKPLLVGVGKHSGRTLAAFLGAVGHILPLMDEQYAPFCFQEIMPVLAREFRTQDDEMRRVVLHVLQQSVSSEGVTREFVMENVVPEYFDAFWVRRMAMNPRDSRQLTDTTLALARLIGAGEVLGRLVDDLKDELEPYRRMVMECITRVLTELGVDQVSPRLEEQLVDGVLYAFQEQGSPGSGADEGGTWRFSPSEVILRGFATVMDVLGERARPYVPQIKKVIEWRLDNKSATVRSQAAALVARLAQHLVACGEEESVALLGQLLYECLGEEFPEALASVLDGLAAVVESVSPDSLKPPVEELLPRVTPILKNRHQAVQEAIIGLVGNVAQRGARKVHEKEWMRVTYDLLEFMTARRRKIRQATVHALGHIAVAIGSQDVLHVLMNNLRVPDRTNRVSTTVAMAIVADKAGPYTVIPALMNEYRTPDLNVQNGVLKALSFMFTYIGEQARDYVYAVSPLLQNALMDRDRVHRQTACATVKHLALGCEGAACEDALLHLLNYSMPNMFETHSHSVQAVYEALEGLRVSLGPARILQYCLQGLFHPARRVREAFWKLYNNLYVYASGQLTPYYPRLPDERRSDLRRAMRHERWLERRATRDLLGLSDRVAIAKGGGHVEIGVAPASGEAGRRSGRRLGIVEDGGEMDGVALALQDADEAFSLPWVPRAAPATGSKQGQGEGEGQAAMGEGEDDEVDAGDEPDEVVRMYSLSYLDLVL